MIQSPWLLLGVCATLGIIALATVQPGAATPVYRCHP